MLPEPAPPATLADGVVIGPGKPLVFVAGPCVVESLEQVVRLATALATLARELQVPLVFKASFDKANRTSGASFRGPGIERGLAALAAAKGATGLPVLTDVHEARQAASAAEVADVLQVPAFLCRQTDLLHACGETGRAVNIKKGQFLAPGDMEHAVAKVTETGNQRVTVTERGSSFGYNNLVVDLRGLPVMRSFAPVIFDATHSLQLPGGLGHATGGAREYHLHLVRGAVAAGVDGVFAEVHENPEAALSDATTQLTVDELRELVVQALAIRRACDDLAGRPAAGHGGGAR